MEVLAGVASKLLMCVRLYCISFVPPCRIEDSPESIALISVESSCLKCEQIRANSSMPLNRGNSKSLEFPVNCKIKFDSLLSTLSRVSAFALIAFSVNV